MESEGAGAPPHPPLPPPLTKWLPSMMEQWLTFVTSLEPHIHSLTAKTFEANHASKSSVVPHVIKGTKGGMEVHTGS